MSQPYKKAKLSTPEKRSQQNTHDLLLGIDFEDDWINEFKDDKENAPAASNACWEIDLSHWTRCIVDGISRDKFDLIFKLRKHKQSDLSQLCRIQPPWTNAKVNVGDVVSVKAVWSPKYSSFVINSENGYLVNLPDQLISGTSVMGSLFCARKGVLQEFFKGLDGDNEIMVIGTIIHELLESVLRRGLASVAEIRACSKELINSSDINFMLYSCQMAKEKLEEEVKSFIPKISAFVQKYLRGGESGSKDAGSFAGKITAIRDIEENIWMPEMGLKGKVDVTVEVQKNLNSIETLLMPLELKTGRASFSAEHKGQVILYQTMMEEMGSSVHSGLLLYLREGILTEVSGNRNEKRDLMILRNVLGYFLSRKYLQEFGVNKFLTLPDPIHHRSACEACPYNTICSLVLKRDKTRKLKDDHPLIKCQKIDHLSDDDLDYFFEWSHCMLMEDEENMKSNSVKRIWTEPVDSRVASGSTISNLKILKIHEEIEGRFLHEFLSKELPSSLQIKTRDYVVVSTLKRYAISSGFVGEINPGTEIVPVVLDRKLSAYVDEDQLTIDKYESQTMLSYHLTNLGILMDSTEVSGRLRKIIVSKKQPTFDAKMPKEILSGKEILKKLNKDQQNAVIKALTARDFLLIKGLPGTGKTQTLVTLVRLLVILGKSILITSHTHSAVDNLLLRLKEHDLKFIRLGSSSRTMPDLRANCDDEIIKSCSSPEEIEMKYNAFPIVAATCLGAGHPLIARREFDVAIVDESTQVLQTAILRPLFSAKRFILVGDPEQLPPLLKSASAVECGGDQSLFVRLDRDETTTCTLSLQYRMNKTITKLANQLTYKIGLKCANEEVESKTLAKVDLKQISEQDRWLEKPLSSHIDFSTVLLNTGCVGLVNKWFRTERLNEVHPENAKITVNYVEAAMIMKTVKQMVKAGLNPMDIGIIAPYRVQVEYLKRFIKSILTKLDIKAEIEVNTVDQYQGRDKDIIIYSGTKSSIAETKQQSTGDILDDRRRLNVAITRAKRKLIVICDQTTLESNQPFCEMFKYFRGPQVVNLSDPKMKLDYKLLLEEAEKELKL